MKYPSIIEYNGKKYMSTKTAADFWGLKPSTVSKYCNKGKICKAFKYLEARWYIPVDAVRPLSNDEIRKFLILTLQLKNAPFREIDWSTFLYDDSSVEQIYRYLVFREMIENFDISDKKRIPYEVVLTQKGLEFVTFREGECEEIGVTMKKWFPIIIELSRLIAQVAQIIVV